MPHRAALFLALFTVDCLAAKMPSLWSTELALGGIRFADTERAVLARLGKPDSQGPKNIKDPVSTYPGLAITYSEDSKVRYVVSTSKSYCTPSQVCPGMPFARAQAAYAAIQILSASGDHISAYFGSKLACKLTFEVQRNIIESIGAGCPLS